MMRAAGDAVSLGAGGFMETPNQRLAVLHELSSIETPDDLARRCLPFAADSDTHAMSPAWSKGFPQPIGDAVINDVPGHSAHR